MRTWARSGSPYEETIGFARAVRVGDTIRVSGTAPVPPPGRAVAANAYEQMLRCGEIVQKALSELGASLADVVRTRMYLVEAADAAEVGRAHQELFGQARPAATMVVVSALLDPCWKVELEAEAVLGASTSRAGEAGSVRSVRVSSRDGYDLWAGSYDETPNPLVELDARETQKLLAPAPGELVLDAGCGTGRHLSGVLAGGAFAVGIDLSLPMLARACSKQPRVPLVAADLASPLPFRGEVFDAVLCSLVGEHLGGLERIASEFHRVLRPGGRMVFSVYHPDMAATGVDANFERSGIEYQLASHRHSVSDYLGAFDSAGFQDVTMREFCCGADVVTRLPRARKYLGRLLLLIIAASRRSGR